MAKTLQLNHFVFRQTPESRFSHYAAANRGAAGWQELEALIADNFAKSVESVTVSDGSVPVRLPLRDDGKIVKLILPYDQCARFYSGVVLVDAASQLRSVFALRDKALPGEQAFIQTVAVGGRKSQARYVEVILYHRDALSLDERTYSVGAFEEPVVQDGEWQVVSINARATTEPEPPTPQAMARNMAAFLGLPEGAGGTPRQYTAEELVEAILYWSKRAMCG